MERWRVRFPVQRQYFISIYFISHILNLFLWSSFQSSKSSTMWKILRETIIEKDMLFLPITWVDKSWYRIIWHTKQENHIFQFDFSPTHTRIFNVKRNSVRVYFLRSWKIRFFFSTVCKLPYAKIFFLVPISKNY